jgi:GNAT superfamily N-acetyltransferase
MITTRFLSTDEYHWYGDWLRDQDKDTKQSFFGMTVSDYFIDNLVAEFVRKQHDNFFLVAEQNGVWIGTMHIAIVNTDEVEFGIIIDIGNRNKGIANQLINEAIIWARNRGYANLYMHCLKENRAIQHLCEKHGLEIKKTISGSEVDTHVKLPKANLTSIGQEYIIRNRNLYHMFLQNQTKLMKSITY